MVISKPGKVEILYTPHDGGKPEKTEVYDFKTPGVFMGMYNVDESIAGFARSSLEL